MKYLTSNSDGKVLEYSNDELKLVKIEQDQVHQENLYNDSRYCKFLKNGAGELNLLIMKLDDCKQEHNIDF